MSLASFRNGTTVAGLGGGGVFYVLEKIEWQPPEWLLWVVGIGSAALILIAAILWGIAAWNWWSARRTEKPQARASAQLVRPLAYDKIRAWDVIWARYNSLSKTPSDDDTLLSQAIADFRLAAKMGTITVWGRPRKSAVFEKIDPLFWETGGIDMLASMKQSGEGGVATTTNFLLDGAKEYVGLRTLRDEVKRLWPDLAAAKGFEYR